MAFANTYCTRSVKKTSYASRQKHTILRRFTLLTFSSIIILLSPPIHRNTTIAICTEQETSSVATARQQTARCYGGNSNTIRHADDATL